MQPGLLDASTDLLHQMIDIRRSIHRQPELGLELPMTQQRILDALAPLDLEIRTGTGLSSVIADLRGGAGDGPTVVLRGDMDALPLNEDTGLDFASEIAGAMHACGHDAHVAMLVGAARLLAARRAELAGTVRFMFQPGEEGFAGASLMIDEGVLDGVDAAFALHISPNIPAGYIGARPGPIMASYDTIRVTVAGRGGHASSPHLANDPVPVACEIVSAWQTFITRRIDIFHPAVLTVGRITAGTTSNVIPETAKLLATLRTVSEQTRAEAKEGIERVVNGVAVAHECSAKVGIETGYPVTVNDPAVVGQLQAIVGELFGPDRYLLMENPVMGAEDFSYVLNAVPGAIAFLGVCPNSVDDPRQAPACHSNRLQLEESAMRDGAALHAAFALDRIGTRHRSDA